MKYFYLVCLLILFNSSIVAQVGIGTLVPEASAILELESIDKGFLPPRLSQTQRDNIGSPATGLFIYNTTENQIEVYDGTQWIACQKAFALKVEYKTVDFSITNTQGETVFIVNNSLTAVATLPALSSVDDGFRVYVKRTGGFLVTVSAATGDTIEGLLTVDIANSFGSVELVATSSQWVMLNGAL